MYYLGENKGEWHPVPLVVNDGKLTGLIQPFLAGTQVQYYAMVEDPNGEAIRVPPQSTFSYTVKMDLNTRLRQKIREFTK